MTDSRTTREPTDAAPDESRGTMPSRVLGYCTNVHAGTTLDEIKQNLATHAAAVRKQVAPRSRLPIGLWIPAKAARALCEPETLADFRDWLEENHFEVFTLNGFPQHDFHQEVVKRRVYEPSWADLSRLNYTIDLITILAELIPEGGEGSISTLPVGWGATTTQRDVHSATSLIHDAVKRMAEVEHRQGKYIHLDFEPEPGCALQRSEDLVRFFRRSVFSHPQSKLARRHLRICHDICHAAVMFEDQAEMLQRYDDLGVSIGKVQISSALRANFDDVPKADRKSLLGELAVFDEPRYLHQTVVKRQSATTEETEGNSQQPEAKSNSTQFFDDLADALEQAKPEGEWRVHFHVPVDLDAIGPLATTQQDILECLRLLRDRTDVRHFEIETYAWDVLPEEHRVEELADGIAREMKWVKQQMSKSQRGGRSQPAEQTTETNTETPSAELSVGKTQARTSTTGKTRSTKKKSSKKTSKKASNKKAAKKASKKSVTKKSGKKASKKKGRKG